MEDVLLDFFKTLVDPNRLRMAAILLDERLTLEEIAARLRLRPADVPRHLAQLEKLGALVREGDRYRLDAKALEKLSRTVLAGRRPAVAAHSNDAEADPFDREVVKNYSLPDGRLKEIPLQEKKLKAILNHVVVVFEPGVRYSEKEVNLALERFHPDFASLRRYLVDRQMIARERDGTVYWRPPLSS
jgi:hypothetical protein